MDDNRKPTTVSEVRQRARRKQTKTNRRLKKRQPVSKDFKSLKTMDPTAFNGQAEQRFVELVRQMIERNGSKPVAIAKVYQDGAYALDVSVETVKRYLFKHSAERAELRVFGKAVMLNPNYVEDEEEDEEHGA